MSAPHKRTNGRLKITDVRLYQLRTVETVGHIEPAWDKGRQMPITVGGGSVVEVFTDEGITGIGPGFDPSLLPVIRNHMLDQDPFDTERHLAVLRYYAAGLPYRGVAGFDIALWDIIGKACGQPLHKLWGGGKDRVSAYASMVLLSTPEARADLAQQLHAEGWQAMKLRLHHPTMAEDLRTVTAVRQATSEDFTIMVDANQAQSTGNWQPGLLWDYARALNTARELDQLGCYWLEEPLPRYAFADIARLNAAVAMPIAGGENNRGVHEFLQMLQDNVYDILQPEGMVSGGLSEMRKIGVLAEAFGKKCVPHHGGRGLGTVAHLHLVASWPHAPYLEVLHDPPIGHYRHGFAILENPLVVESDGCIAVPQGPGLGVELDRSLIQETLSA
jgi:D-galactarolactone cycloisomerase